MIRTTPTKQMTTTRVNRRSIPIANLKSKVSVMGSTERSLLALQVMESILWLRYQTTIYSIEKLLLEYLSLKELEKKFLESELKAHDLTGHKSESELTIQRLETELKSVYVKLIEVTKAKKQAEKEATALRAELDYMANTVKYVEDKEDQMENSYFYGNKNPALYHIKQTGQKTKDSSPPKMIPIKKIDTSVVKSEVQSNSDTTLRTIFHDNKFVHKVET